MSFSARESNFRGFSLVGSSNIVSSSRSRSRSRSRSSSSNTHGAGNDHETSRREAMPIGTTTTEEQINESLEARRRNNADGHIHATSSRTAAAAVDEEEEEARGSLREAIENGCWNAVQEILEEQLHTVCRLQAPQRERYSVNVHRNVFGETVTTTESVNILHLVLLQGRRENKKQKVIRRSFQPNVIPLVEIVEKLLIIDPELAKEPATPSQELPLHFAARQHHSGGSSFDVIKTLLMYYPEATRMVSFHGNLPLHIACAEARKIPILLLLSMGLNATPRNCFGQNGYTPWQLVKNNTSLGNVFYRRRARGILKGHTDVLDDIAGDHYDNNNVTNNNATTTATTMIINNNNSIDDDDYDEEDDEEIISFASRSSIAEGNENNSSALLQRQGARIVLGSNRIRNGDQFNSFVENENFESPDIRRAAAATTTTEENENEGPNEGIVELYNDRDNAPFSFGTVQQQHQTPAFLPSPIIIIREEEEEEVHGGVEESLQQYHHVQRRRVSASSPSSSSSSSSAAAAPHIAANDDEDDGIEGPCIGWAARTRSSRGGHDTSVVDTWAEESKDDMSVGRLPPAGHDDDLPHGGAASSCSPPFSNENINGNEEQEQRHGDGDRIPPGAAGGVWTNNNNKKKNENNEYYGGLCVVCWDGIANHVLVPCGHVCLCKDCGRVDDDENPLWSGGGRLNRKCPVCTKPFDQCIKIYHAGVMMISAAAAAN